MIDCHGESTFANRKSVADGCGCEDNYAELEVGGEYHCKPKCNPACEPGACVAGDPDKCITCASDNFYIP